MNIPEVYLVEPYNAYAPKNRKKHWHEVVEEQALLARIHAEQQAIQEAANRTLPQNSPQVSTPPVATVGQAAGAGGLPYVSYFSPTMTAGISLSSLTASAPSTINIVNTSSPDTLAGGVATFLWNFGDGVTSTLPQPLTHSYTTTGSNFLVTLKITSVSNTSLTSSVTQSLNVNPPTCVASFTLSSSLTSSATTQITTSVASASIAFVNGTTTDNASNTISYLWTFGSGSITSSLRNPPLFTYTATGSYTVRLTATGSFNIATSQSRLAVLVVS